MAKYPRVFVIVLDSLGVGRMADSDSFGDYDVDTLGHIAQKAAHLNIPNLQRWGAANLHSLQGIPPVANPLARYAKLNERSAGKDTMTGHWEMMGLHTTKPFITFTETGFPRELLDELEKRTGHKVIGNKAASGTEILDELAEEEIATGHMIVYTSADSVLQICGNEETFDLKELYRCCEIARELTMKDEWKVGRVIARPYLGRKKGEFVRTANRHDYAVKPFGRTTLNVLKDAGLDVISIGKINDIFVGEGITEAYKSQSSVHGMEQTIEVAQKDFTGIRKYVVADPIKLAKASIKASRAGRQMLVYGFSQKALHVASKLIPTSWILFIEKKLMPVEKAAAAVKEEGRIPYVPEEKRELESGASVEGIPQTDTDIEDKDTAKTAE